MPTTQRTADRKQHPLPDHQQWTVTLGRVAAHVPGMGGDPLILVCCRTCGNDLVRLVPGDELTLDGTMFFECSACRQTRCD
ncbi:MAG: hypothetical protein OXG72_12595 [Acidobacteria bacterium]|nr:hypothetical protein [Acidobacteriota bacterium]